MAVGKSTTARVLKALLARWPDHPRVDLMTTDGFLLPNAELERRGLMDRKGFPESFDTARLLQFLGDIKSGVARVAAPVYSHFQYDILPSQEVFVEQPDILIVEGLNVLQPAGMPQGRRGDSVRVGLLRFFDLYRRRSGDHREVVFGALHALAQTAFRDPGAYFHKYATMPETEVRQTATTLWREINLKNLQENILPTRRRAQLILQKGESHRVEKVSLRKI